MPPPPNFLSQIQAGKTLKKTNEQKDSSAPRAGGGVVPTTGGIAGLNLAEGIAGLKSASSRSRPTPTPLPPSNGGGMLAELKRRQQQREERASAAIIDGGNGSSSSNNSHVSRNNNDTRSTTTPSSVVPKVALQSPPYVPKKGHTSPGSKTIPSTTARKPPPLPFNRTSTNKGTHVPPPRPDVRGAPPPPPTRSHKNASTKPTSPIAADAKPGPPPPPARDYTHTDNDHANNNRSVTHTENANARIAPPVRAVPPVRSNDAYTHTKNVNASVAPHVRAVPPARSARTAPPPRPPATSSSSSSPATNRAPPPSPRSVPKPLSPSEFTAGSPHEIKKYPLTSPIEGAGGSMFRDVGDSDLQRRAPPPSPPSPVKVALSAVHDDGGALRAQNELKQQEETRMIEQQQEQARLQREQEQALVQQQQQQEEARIQDQQQQQLLNSNAVTATVTFDFEAENSDELSCSTGQVLVGCIALDDPEWFDGATEDGQHSGLIPICYLQIHAAAPKPIPQAIQHTSPPVLEKDGKMISPAQGMIQALLRRGSYADLFIETGSTQHAERLVDQVKHAHSRDEVDSIVNACGDPCTVALAVKLHFKHLSEPAFPFRFFPELISLQRGHTSEADKVNELRSLIQTIDEPIQSELRSLFSLLSHTAHANDNYTTRTTRLAYLLGPTLAKRKHQNPDPLKEIEDVKIINLLFEVAIRNQDKIFLKQSGVTATSGAAAPPPSLPNVQRPQADATRTKSRAPPPIPPQQQQQQQPRSTHSRPPPPPPPAR